MSVNLSQRQFSDPKLVDLVARALKDAGLPPALLELEIAEPTLMRNAEQAAAVLGRLRALGVRLAIDAFGASYSSLLALQSLRVDTLKIDRGIVADAHEGGRPVVAGIVGLAHALGLRVTAVGVEIEAQKQALLASGCDFLQGFLTGAPAEADAAARDFV